MAKVGRKTKLTPEVSKIILETLRIGATFSAAAGRAGVAESTIHKWRAAGKAYGGKSHLQQTKEIREFAVAVDRALADAETRLVGMINKASNQQWQAAAWLLERRWAGQYGSRQKVEMNAKIEQFDPRDAIARKLGLAERGANPGDGAEPEG